MGTQGSDRTVRSLRLDLDEAAPAAARRFVAAAAADWGLDAEQLEIAQLVISELVSNVVEHAATPGELILERLDGKLSIAVRDESATLPVARPLDTNSFRGRGLALVERLSHSWGVTPHPDGKTVWALLSTPGAAG